MPTLKSNMGAQKQHRMSSSSKILLVSLNGFVILLGLALFTTGGVLKGYPSFIQDQIALHAPAFLPEMPDDYNLVANKQIPGGDSGGFDVDTLMDGFSPYIDILAGVMIAAGAVMLVVGLLGFCGVVCDSTISLSLYLVILALALFLQLTFCVNFFNGTLEDQIKTTVQKTINEDYGGFNSFDGSSVLLNLAMVKFECCGLDDYEDFDTAAEWENKLELDLFGIEMSKKLLVPFACCKMKGEFPNFEPRDLQCAFNPTSHNTNYKQGCAKKIKESLVEHILYVIVPMAAMIISTMITIAACLVLLYQRAELYVLKYGKKTESAELKNGKKEAEPSELNQGSKDAKSSQLRQRKKKTKASEPHDNGDENS